MWYTFPKKTALGSAQYSQDRLDWPKQVKVVIALCLSEKQCIRRQRCLSFVLIAPNGFLGNFSFYVHVFIPLFEQ